MRKKREAKTDFTEAKLPHTRVEVFFDCFKLRFLTFMRLGATLLLSVLPLIAIWIARDLMIADAFGNSADTAVAARNAQGALLFFDVLAIPFYAVASVGFAGVMRVIRALAWGEPVFYRRDTLDGIKLNGKIFAFVFTVAGAVSFCVDLAMQSQCHVIVKGLCVGISLVLLLPLGLLILMQATVYKIGFGEALKNSFLFYVKTAPATLLATACMALPVLFSLIPNTVVKHIVIACYVLLLMPFALLGWFLYGCRVLDKFVNSYYHTEIVDKGIYRLDKEEMRLLKESKKKKK